MRRRRAVAGMLAGVSALVTGMIGCGSDPGSSGGAAPDPVVSTLDRPADPVVVTGAQLEDIAGGPPDRLVGFRATSDGWEQIPVQVDERLDTTVQAAYDLPAGQFGSSTDIPVNLYADPGTFVGADPDATFDADDEIVLMARDAGGDAGDLAAPDGTAGGGIELRLDDPQDGGASGYVYLFRSDGSLDPAAGRQYVDYDFVLGSGDYRATYKRSAGPNPEDSTVTGRTYSVHFSDRWLLDQLVLTTGGSPEADLVDRARQMFPRSCLRSEDTFDEGEGAFVVNKSGPVRALRSYVGANSGPNTQATLAFYDMAVDTTFDLRVHVIPGVASHLDLTRAATGMTYRNPQVPDGVPIDATADTVPPAAPSWWTITGPPGGLAFSTTIDTSLAVLEPRTHYEDDTTPATLQCTGDLEAVGQTGATIDQMIACTDPGTGCTDHLRSTTRMVALDTDTDTDAADPAEAQRLAEQGLAPLTVAATPFPRPT